MGCLNFPNFADCDMLMDIYGTYPISNILSVCLLPQLSDTFPLGKTEKLILNECYIRFKCCSYLSLSFCSISAFPFAGFIHSLQCFPSRQSWGGFLDFWLLQSSAVISILMLARVNFLFKCLYMEYLHCLHL